MQPLFYILLAIILVSCRDIKVSDEQKVFDRIEFVYHFKETIQENVWQTFNLKEFDVPLIYYTDSSSYVANPTEKFISVFQPNLVYESPQLKIFKTDKMIDSIPFHMETGMTLGDPTDEYNFHSPFMQCSSVEITMKTIPDVKSTEQWATMIMHEYFHGFQYKHPPYVNYYEKNVVQIQPDSLIAIYKHNKWFKDKVDLENHLLLQALIEKDKIKINTLIDIFFRVRDDRRKHTTQNLNFNIATYEKHYETMEGTARYLEYKLCSIFATRRPDEKLLRSDTSFKSFNKFRNYKLQSDPWLYKTEKTSYFYATGFNMARLLDKLGVEYKSKLFNQGHLTLEQLLDETRKKAK